MIARLTTEERALLIMARASVMRPGAGAKALRIIDAHAADRAALVAQVTELTRERDEARADATLLRGAAKTFETEVTRLTEALAAAEAKAIRWRDAQCAAGDRQMARAEAAEARVRELEAQLAASQRVQAKAEEHLELHRTEDPHVVSELRHELWQRNSECKALSQDRHELKQQLAAANALLARCQYAVSPVSLLGRDLDAHLAAQPAMAPARDDEVFGCVGCFP